VTADYTLDFDRLRQLEGYGAPDTARRAGDDCAATGELFVISH